jgi:hypothetical protein
MRTGFFLMPGLQRDKVPTVPRYEANANSVIGDFSYALLRITSGWQKQVWPRCRRNPSRRSPLIERLALFSHA